MSVISLNDGPFFTLMALGILGERFPIAAFLGVLLPMVIGFIIGQVSESARQFLASGEKLCIPFFAFALGTSMNFSVFLDTKVLVGGLVLGIATVLLTGSACAVALRLSGERSVIAGLAEASTSGNAVQTPLAVSIAAGLSAGAAGTNPYAVNVPIATARISISVITTAILCPAMVALVHSRVTDSTVNFDTTDRSPQ